MSDSRSAVLLLAALALLAGSPLLRADPGERHSPPAHRSSAAPAGREHPGGWSRDARSERHGQSRGDRDYRRERGHAGALRIDDGRVRGVVGDNRDYWRPGAALPPGIRKNLRRGKPLPPGIERHWLDGRLERRLPYYDGYEWLRTGNDLVLISIGTGLVNVVLYDIFR